jgi:predicted nucleotidyltransferase
LVKWNWGIEPIQKQQSGGMLVGLLFLKIEFPLTRDIIILTIKFYEVIKMIDITTWMHRFLQTLHETFANRVWFVGLQGSYGRGEATETSDIDVVVILDELSAMDIQTYHTTLDTMPDRELICGFLSGKKEIMNWEPSDLFQLCHDTTPIK